MIFDYSYDANGRIRMGAFRQNESATPGYFYYALNSRGDVVGLYNGEGEVIAKYTYDAWGNETSITDADGNSVAHRDILATRQPFRYRGYYYDKESKLYYLQSRYYDPVTHRFINADGLVSTGTGVLGHNMFACCDNNPVNYFDPKGEKYIQLVLLDLYNKETIELVSRTQVLSRAIKQEQHIIRRIVLLINIVIMRNIMILHWA